MENIYTITARKVIASYDLDGDGYLTAEEIKPFFQEYIMRSQNKIDEATLFVWFNQVDAKKDGKLDMQELEACFQQDDFKEFNKGAAEIITPDANVPDIIEQQGARYKKVEQKAKGAFSIVYLYQDERRNGINIAVKIPKQDSIAKEIVDNDLQTHKILSKMRIPSIPRYFGFLKSADNICKLSEYVDMSLEEYMNSDQQKKSFRDISLEMFDSISAIHNQQYILQNIKPQSFRVNNNHQVKIIDFGHATEYIGYLEEHITRQRVTQQFVDPIFASIDSLDGNTQSRRDDLESLGYVLLSFRFSWIMPWQIQPIKDQSEKNLEPQEDLAEVEHRQRIMKAKTNFIKSENNNLSIKYLHTFIKTAHSLAYEEQPNYQLLRSFLQKVDEPLFLEAIKGLAQSETELNIKQMIIEIAREQIQQEQMRAYAMKNKVKVMKMEIQQAKYKRALASIDLYIKDKVSKICSVTLKQEQDRLKAIEEEKRKKAEEERRAALERKRKRQNSALYVRLQIELSLQKHVGTYLEEQYNLLVSEYIQQLKNEEIAERLRLLKEQWKKEEKEETEREEEIRRKAEKERLEEFTRYKEAENAKIKEEEERLKEVQRRIEDEAARIQAEKAQIEADRLKLQKVKEHLEKKQADTSK